MADHLELELNRDLVLLGTRDWPLDRQPVHWPRMQLGAVAELLTGFPFKSEEYTVDHEAPRLLRGDNVAQGTLRWSGAKRWAPSATAVDSEYWLREGDVVVAMDRPWIAAGLKYARVGRSDVPALLVQRVARLRGTKRLNTRFLYYVIGSRDFIQYVTSVQTGTAVPHISARQIKDFTFCLPPLSEQGAIAYVLGTLDDKIELNRRMNEMLEATARALFKSWFVDFEPVRAKAAGRNMGLPHHVAVLFPGQFNDEGLPMGWRLSEIGREVRVVGGATPSTKEPAFWDGGEHHWATPKDLSGLQSPVLLDTDRKLTDAGVNKISSGLLPVGTVLMSSRAPIGYLAIAGVPTAVNQGFIAMICEGLLPNVFVLFWCEQQLDYIKGISGGSTFAEISKRAFRPAPVVIPSAEVLLAYSSVVGPIFDRLVANAREAISLAKTRDLLLPKLISGELRVPDAERIAGAVI